MQSFVLKGPLESRKASQNLRDQLIEHLLASRVKAGTPFFSDAELMELSGLSRTTVRKALAELHREGWIARQPGEGSYVGVRVNMPVAPLTRRAMEACRSVVRLAVLAYGMDGETVSWVSRLPCHLVEGESVTERSP